MNKTLFCCFGYEIGSSRKFFFLMKMQNSNNQNLYLRKNLQMIIQSFNFVPKRIVGQFRRWIFISMRAPKKLLFLSIFWRIKKQKSNPLILSLRNISDLCFSPFFYIISSFILDFILLTSFNKLFTGLKTWEYMHNSSTSLTRGGLQVGLQCCCCASVQCLKVFINLPSLRTPLSHTGWKGKW